MKVLKAWKLITLIPDVISFVTITIEYLEDRKLDEDEIDDLVKRGSELIEKLK